MKPEVLVEGRAAGVSSVFLSLGEITSRSCFDDISMTSCQRDALSTASLRNAFCADRTTQRLVFDLNLVFSYLINSKKTELEDITPKMQTSFAMIIYSTVCA